MPSDILLILSWVGFGALCVSLLFLLTHIRRLKMDNSQFQILNRSMQENLARECERRAIAEEKNSRLYEVEQMLHQKSKSIETLLLDQSGLKSQLAEKEM